METKITALYCRISREDEFSKESSSIETQKAYLNRYANQNKFYNTRCYVDDGFSGTNFERPSFIKLKKDIENDLVSIVITKDLSRLGRDYLSTGYYIEHYFPLYDVRYIAINDQVDTDKCDNDLAPFRNIMNEWYARDISKKIRSAYHTKALNGEFTGAYPPYGYDKNPKNKHQLIINDRQAKIVRQVYGLYLKGISIYKISRILKENRIFTPRTDLYRIHGSYESIHTKKYPYEWAPQTIMNILLNEVYIGKIVCNKNQTKTFKTKQLKRNPKTKWIISEHKHEVIIDNNTFKKVQELITKSKKLPKTAHVNVLKGKVRCVDCGKTLSLSIRNDRTIYGSLSCSTYRRYGKVRCTSHYITYNYWVEYTRLMINKIIELSNLGENEFRDKIIKHTSLKKTKQKIEIKLNSYQDRKKEINVLIKKLFEKYINDQISENKFYELDKSYDQEKVQINEEIKTIENNLAKISKQINDVSTFYGTISRYDEITELKREDIVKLIDKIVIHQKIGKNKKRLVDIYFVLIGKI